MQLLKNNELMKYKLKIKNFKLKLNQNNLTIVAQRMGWEGQGTKKNPIIVNPRRNLPLKLTLMNIHLHLNLKNLTLTSLNLFRCKHLSIEDCKINNLNLNRCQENTIRNNSIIRIESFLSRSNNFENNEIFNVLNHRFERLGFRLFLVFTLIFSSLMIYSGIRGIANRETNWVTFYLLILGITVTSAISYFLILHFKMRKLQPNLFKENFSMTRLNQLFSN